MNTTIAQMNLLAPNAINHEKIQMKESIIGLPLNKLIQKFEEKGLSKLDAKRVFPWIHQKLEISFEKMSDLPKKTREDVLPVLFSLDRPWCKELQKSLDGTQKALLQFQDGECIETVFIPDEKRNTICVSTQIGCPIGCKFCNTGTQSFSRNLSASEIMAQIFFWKDLYKITNIVFMGMGEPLLNSENLFDALTLLLDEKAHNFSRNKITVSTSGVFPSVHEKDFETSDDSISKLAKFGVKLAISLHAPNDEIRSNIMPINNRFNIGDIMRACRKYLKLSNTNHITFEYLLLSGINDSTKNANELASLMKNFCRSLKQNSCRVNLISFNDWSQSKFKGTSYEKTHAFLRILLAKNIRAIARKSRGLDILAACGQLKSDKNSNHSINCN